jgi:hypothetical protein
MDWRYGSSGSVPTSLVEALISNPVPPKKQTKKVSLKQQDRTVRRGSRHTVYMAVGGSV